MLIALAVQFDWELDQMDVVGAYLNATLPDDEVLYMDPIPGLHDGSNKVHRVVKSLYGLKQAGRAWNTALNDFLTMRGYQRLNADHCAYMRTTGHDFTILAVHVDDMAILAPNRQVMDAAKQEISSKFPCKDLSLMRRMVGLEVHRNRGSKTIHLSQGLYIRKVLARFGMNSANPTHTPLLTNENLTKMEDLPTLCNDEPYAELVGSLMYAAVGSRPDLTHTVSALSQFTTRYERQHWMAAKRTL